MLGFYENTSFLNVIHVVDYIFPTKKDFFLIVKVIFMFLLQQYQQPLWTFLMFKFTKDAKWIFFLHKTYAWPSHYLAGQNKIGHVETQTMQTADCRLQNVQTGQTVQTECYFFLLVPYYSFPKERVRWRKVSCFFL